jgi:hypothetical protein
MALTPTQHARVYHAIRSGAQRYVAQVLYDVRREGGVTKHDLAEAVERCTRAPRIATRGRMAEDTLWLIWDRL